ncbi:hypothetical protein B0H14DRAFT_3503574 [Mycena olivaceomarginata]|nr:hypothetical protein B0H14DRAFT_3503574 [Mycena olivaceomarginata]
MAPRINYNTEIGWRRAGDIVREKYEITISPLFFLCKPNSLNRHLTSSTTNSLGCWLFNGSRNTDGYAQQAFLLHVVTFVSQDPTTPYNPKLYISHLCDTCNCFNLAHLTLESAMSNNGRKGCSYAPPLHSALEEDCVLSGGLTCGDCAQEVWGRAVN